MDETRGLVLNRRGRRLTVLTPAGRFITMRSPRKDIMPGEEIALTPPGVSWILANRLGPALALSALLLIASMFGWNSYLSARPALAYVTFDSTSSIELEVNDRGLVTSATSFDKGGASLLSGIDYRLKPAGQVIAALAGAQKDSGSEPPEGVILGIVPAMGESSSKTLSKLDKIERKIVKELEKLSSARNDPSPDAPGKPILPITSLRLDMETREDAKKLGISAGRAASWALSKEQARQVGQDTKPGDATPGHASTQPGSSPSKTPGKDRATDDPLTKIKKNVPSVNLDESITEKDVKEQAKIIKDRTKQWVDQVLKEMSKDQKNRKDSKTNKDNKAGKDNKSSKNRKHTP